MGQFEKGHKKLGGRQPGSRNNKVSWDELCEKHGYVPGELSILATQGKAPCSTCFGKGKTRFQPGGGKKASERTCQSCWGSGYERSTLAVRLEADSKNARRSYPDLKAVEHSGAVDLGGDIYQAIIAARQQHMKDRGNGGSGSN